ncbi:MAG: SpoIIE family protein phosphatase, partial [Bacteroidia bacterium]|nr:SpoIIE family protein phosphatase [Bacteroidia bacterium]
DDQNKKVVYCGALRPLLHIRKKTLSVYSPNKHSIGGFNYGEARDFKETEIQMEEGDMLYIFSDGYADQFGGENGKKFMLKNFKELLVSISEEEMYKQEDIVEKSYNSWKGQHDQVDDVLVIGMRM